MEDAGYRVIEAADGGEAVKRFADNRKDIQIVLLDVLMPVMNGKEVYERIRKLDPSIKALFISGYSADMISKKGALKDGLTLFRNRTIRRTSL